MNILDETEPKAGKLPSFAGRFSPELPSLFEMNRANEKGSIQIVVGIIF